MKVKTQTEAAPVGLRIFLSKLPSVAGLLVWAVILLCLGYATPAQAGLKIYYLRHAEYGGNVVDQWKDTPKQQWPAYVGRSDAFTPKGKEQVAALTKKLKDYHFDFIAVSPAWRTRNTIAPYLKEAGVKAEIWPELQEFNAISHQHDPNLPPPSADLFSEDATVSLSSQDQGLFTLRGDNPKPFNIGKDPIQAAADRRAVVDKNIEMIHKRFGNSDKKILLVGHGNSGRIMAEVLTHEKKAFEADPRNTAMWMAEEQPDGSFKLLLLNDEPFNSPALQGAHSAP